MSHANPIVLMVGHGPHQSSFRLNRHLSPINELSASLLKEIGRVASPTLRGLDIAWPHLPVNVDSILKMRVHIDIILDGIPFVDDRF